jgi:hypothetical protein
MDIGPYARFEAIYESGTPTRNAMRVSTHHEKGD